MIFINVICIYINCFNNIMTKYAVLFYISLYIDNKIIQYAYTLHPYVYREKM